MPTKIMPCSRSVGPIAAQISRSRAVSVRLLRPAADMHVGARLACRRHAVHHADRLAVDQDDALVALPHRRLVALEHQRLARAGEVHLQQRGQVLVVRLDAEHAGAAVAEQRLDDDVLVFERGRRGSPRGPR